MMILWTSLKLRKGKHSKISFQALSNNARQTILQHRELKYISNMSNSKYFKPWKIKSNNLWHPRQKLKSFEKQCDSNVWGRASMPGNKLLTRQKDKFSQENANSLQLSSRPAVYNYLWESEESTSNKTLLEIEVKIYALSWR